MDKLDESKEGYLLTIYFNGNDNYKYPLEPEIKEFLKGGYFNPNIKYEGLKFFNKLTNYQKELSALKKELPKEVERLLLKYQQHVIGPMERLEAVKNSSSMYK